jgi:hypothetical protein
VDGLFGGSAAPLVAHLADMNELSLDDLKAIETRLKTDSSQDGSDSESRRGRRRRRKS